MARGYSNSQGIHPYRPPLPPLKPQPGEHLASCCQTHELTEPADSATGQVATRFLIIYHVLRACLVGQNGLPTEFVRFILFVSITLPVFRFINVVF